MKNIHVLPTDQPSRLFSALKGKELCLSGYPERFFSTGQYIYITSDEKIKTNDYYLWKGNTVIKANDIEISFHSTVIADCKKIILTTDQDLIKDGVQAIPDEFLEWFVKNTKCEFVKIEVELLKLVHNPNYNDFTPEGDGIYLTPREENLQNTETLIEDNVPYYKIIIPKQKTLEELAIIHAHKSFVWPLNKQGEKQSIPPGQLVPPGYTKYQKVAQKHFKAGYNEVEQRMYSEEEVRNIVDQTIEKFHKHNYNLTKSELKKQWFENWFEQFKKK